MAKIQKNIKKLRGEKGFTQDALAEKINVTRQTISSWENGRTQPDIDMLELLADALEVGIEEIIYGEKRKIGLEAPKSDKHKVMNIVFATLGSLLTATGLIIILVSFWNKLPEIFLAFLSFVPLLLGGIIAAWACSKKRNSIGWSEGASVAWAAGLIATFALVCAMFDVDLNFDFSMVALAVMILPMAFIMNSVFPLTAYYFIVTYLASYTAFSSFDLFTVITGIALYLIGLIYVIKTQTGDYKRKYSVWLTVISAVVILTCISIELAEYMLPAAFCILLGILTALYAADKGDDFPYPFRVIAVPGIAIILSVLCYDTESWLGGVGYLSSEPELLSPGIAPFASAALLAAGVLFGKESFKKNYVKTAFTAISALTCTVCALCSVFAEFIGANTEDFLSIAMTVTALAASIILIIGGIRKAKMLTVNLGLIMLCIIIYMTIFMGRFDVVYSGIACVVMGTILLFINYRLSKAFKAKEGEQNAQK